MNALTKVNQIDKAMNAILVAQAMLVILAAFYYFYSNRNVIRVPRKPVSRIYRTVSVRNEVAS